MVVRDADAAAARSGMDPAACQGVAADRDASRCRGLDRAQTGEFLDAISGEPLFAVFHLIAMRGLRRGEACGLRWDDLDLDEGLA